MLDDAFAGYLDQLTREGAHDSLLDEMEALAESERIPIIGRSSGLFVEMIARSIRAHRVLELRPGFGYSTYWFARAVGESGSVIVAEPNDQYREISQRLLRKAGLAERVIYRGGDPLTSLAAEEGDFDVIFCDERKDRYPECWNEGSRRIRVGGLWIADNALWHGGAVSGTDVSPETRGFSSAVRMHNAAVASDPGYMGSLVPIRDGLMVALRIHDPARKDEF